MSVPSSHKHEVLNEDWPYLEREHRLKQSCGGSSGLDSAPLYGRSSPELTHTSLQPMRAVDWGQADPRDPSVTEGADAGTNHSVKPTAVEWDSRVVVGKLPSRLAGI